jgi:hypothetical protein
VSAWSFFLRCGTCGDEAETTVFERSLQRLSSGGFAPLRCEACGAFSLVPTARPWAPTANDQKLLRSMRIETT